MTPKEYLDRYTYLKFYSPLNNELISAGISMYGSGWEYRNGKSGAGQAMQREHAAFTAALRMAHHGDVNKPCGAKFFFDQKSLGLIRPTEDFYASTFIQAFVGKGSPDEIIDTLRLAYAIGRIGVGKDAAGQPCARATAQIYATDFMTLDCNGLVGNYYGGQPSASIEAYASTSRRRTRIEDIQPGDAVVTHCTAAPYEHVGLIDSCSVDGSTANIRLVEWGWYGSEDVHYSKEAKACAITQGLRKPTVSDGSLKATPSLSRPFATFSRVPARRNRTDGPDPDEHNGDFGSNRLAAQQSHRQKEGRHGFDIRSIQE